MPFTPAHILAIVPIVAIRRSPLPLSALVIGSMIPDLPLFVAFAPDYGDTHSVGGLFTACLPLGLAAILAFQLVMKRPLFLLLPAVIQRRCGDASASCLRGPRTVIYAAIAVVIGAATHVFWDSFTHEGRWGTRQFPLLNETALTVAGHDFTGSKLLQYGCTAVGLPGLAVLAALWIARRAPGPPDGTPSLGARGKVAAAFVGVVVPASTAAAVWLRNGSPMYSRTFHAVTASGLSLMVVTLVYCLGFQARGRPSAG